MDDALQALPQCRSAEIDQQTDAQMHQTQIGEQLPLMNRKRLFDGLDLDDDAGLDQHVGRQTVTESEAIEFESDRFLPDHAKTAPLKFPREDDFVDRLHQSRSKARVQFVGCVDDITCDVVQC